MIYRTFYALLISVLITSVALAQSSHQLNLPTPITFKTGSDRLTTESEKALDFIKKYLEEKPSVSLIRIESHVESNKSAKDAQTLTEKRSLAVAQALIKKGVDCKKIVAVGFGSSKPISDNNTPEGKLKNNRLVVFNAALKGKAIGGLPIDGGGKPSLDLCQK